MKIIEQAVQSLLKMARKVPCASLITSLTMLAAPCVANNCVTDKLPDFVQGSSTSTEIVWNAVTYTSGDANSIYLAGSAESSQLFSQSAKKVLAGKHNISKGAIVWAKQLVSSDYAEATAVAVNSSATIMAVAGFRILEETQEEFYFFLDPSTGGYLHPSFYYTHYADQGREFTYKQKYFSGPQSLVWIGSELFSTASNFSMNNVASGKEHDFSRLNISRIDHSASTVYYTYFKEHEHDQMLGTCGSIIGLGSDVVYGCGYTPFASNKRDSENEWRLALFKIGTSDASITHSLEILIGGTHYESDNSFPYLSNLAINSAYQLYAAARLAVDSTAVAQRNWLLEFNFDSSWSTMSTGTMYEVTGIGSDTQVMSIASFSSQNLQGISASAAGTQTYYWTFNAGSLTALEVYQSTYDTKAGFIYGTGQVEDTLNSVNLYQNFIVGKMDSNNGAFISSLSKSTITCDTQPTNQASWTLVNSNSNFDSSFSSSISGDYSEQQITLTVSHDDLATFSYVAEDLKYQNAAIDNMCSTDYSSVSTLTAGESTDLVWLNEITIAETTAWTTPFSVAGSCTPSFFYYLECLDNSSIPLELVTIDNSDSASPLFRTMTSQSSGYYSAATYNMQVTAVAEGGATNTFPFKLIILAGSVFTCATVPSVVIIPPSTAVSNQNYGVNQSSQSVDFSDFSVTSPGSVCTTDDIVYSLSVSPVASFISLSSKTISWSTTDSLHANTYTVSIVGTIQSVTNTQAYSFDIVVYSCAQDSTSYSVIASTPSLTASSYNINDSSSTATIPYFTEDSVACQSNHQDNMYYELTSDTANFFTMVDTSDPIVISWYAQLNDKVGTNIATITGYIDSVTRHESSVTISITTVGTCAGTISNDYSLNKQDMVTLHKYKLGQSQQSLQVPDVVIDAQSVASYCDNSNVQYLQITQTRADPSQSYADYAMSGSSACIQISGQSITWNAIASETSCKGDYSILFSASIKDTQHSNVPSVDYDLIQITIQECSTAYDEISFTPPVVTEQQYIVTNAESSYTFDHFGHDSFYCTDDDISYDMSVDGLGSEFITLNQRTITWSTLDEKHVGFFSIVITAKLQSLGTERSSTVTIYLQVLSQCYSGRVVLDSSASLIEDIDYTIQVSEAFKSTITWFQDSTDGNICWENWIRELSDQNDVQYDIGSVPVQFSATNKQIDLETMALIDEGEYEMTLKLTNNLIDQAVNKTFFVYFKMTINLPPTYPPFFSQVRSNLMFYSVSDFLASSSILLGTIRAFNVNIEPTITQIQVFPSDQESTFDFVSNSEQITIDYKSLVQFQNEQTSDMQIEIQMTLDDHNVILPQQNRYVFIIEIIGVPPVIVPEPVTQMKTYSIFDLQETQISLTQFASYEVGSSYSLQRVVVVPEGAKSLFSVSLEDDKLDVELIKLKIEALNSKTDLKFQVQIYITNEDLNTVNEYSFNFVSEAKKEQEVTLDLPYFNSMSIGSQGQVKVYFSEEIQVKSNLNYTAFNDSIEVSFVQRTKFVKESKLKIAYWNLTEFESTYFAFSLKFENPLYVSSEDRANYDQLSVTCLDPSMFQVKNSFKKIEFLSHIKSVIPPQLSNDEEQNKVLFSLVGTASSGGKGVLLGVLIGQFLVSGALNQLWAAVNSLQLITHLIHLNAYVPQNIQMFNQVLEELSNFELFDTQIIFEYLGFEVSHQTGKNQKFRLLQQEEEEEEEEQEDQEPPESFLQSIGTFILLGPVLVVCLIAYAMLWFMTSTLRQPLLRKSFVYLNDKLFWNETTRAFFESYMSFTFTSLTLIFSSLKWSTQLQIFDSISALAVLTLLLFVPLIMTRKVVSNFHRITFKSFNVKYKALVEDISSKARWSGLHILIFCYRRVLQVTLIYGLKSHFTFQMQLMTQMTVVIMIIYGLNKFAKQTNLQLFNEWCLLASCYLYFVFSDFVPDAAVRYQMGFALIGVIAFNFIVNVCMILMHFALKILKLLNNLRLRNEFRLKKAKFAELRKALKIQRERDAAEKERLRLEKEKEDLEKQLNKKEQVLQKHYYQQAAEQKFSAEDYIQKVPTLIQEQLKQEQDRIKSKKDPVQTALEDIEEMSEVEESEDLEMQAGRKDNKHGSPSLGYEQKQTPLLIDQTQKPNESRKPLQDGPQQNFQGNTESQLVTERHYDQSSRIENKVGQTQKVPNGVARHDWKLEKRGSNQEQTVYTRMMQPSAQSQLQSAKKLTPIEVVRFSKPE